MGLKFANFATSTIANAGGIGSGDLSLDVQSGDGALFPSLGGSDYFYCVLVDSSGNREVIKVTAVSTDTFTIVRGEDGSTPRAFAQNDKVELRLTQGAMEELRDLTDNLLDEDDMASDSATNTASQQSVKAYTDDLVSLLNVVKPFVFHRSIFTYNGGAAAYTVKCGAGCYYVKDKVAHWVSELTTTAVGTPSADTWYYLYLDYSAITSGTAITNSELIWSSTAPTYNHTYGGWYNGDDRCVFAVLTNSTPNNIIAFEHDGGSLINWQTEQHGSQYDSFGTTWTDVDISDSVPGFSTRAQVTFRFNRADASTILYWRKNGTSGAHTIAWTMTTATRTANTVFVDLDTSQILEISESGASTNQTFPEVNGWCLPIGL